jgi:8-oxo-dGTP pyrophosphatase MutT (NUDIX family)
MWLFTRFGFFSVVRKDSNSDTLTVRSRTRGDLDRLRSHYLPALSPSRQHQGTDYPRRGTVEPADLEQAMALIVRDIRYPNFKDEVAASIGKDRARRYGKVWSALHDMSEDLPEPRAEGFEGLPWGAKPPTGKAMAYGGVVISPDGYVLLREVKNHFDGYVWTFAKGRQDKGEAPRDTALREVREEMGIQPTILTAIPGEFAGGTTINRYFLMVTARHGADLAFNDQETAGLRWANVAEAKDLIALTTNSKGQQRDLSILDAALACLPSPLPLERPIARRSDLTTRPLPAARVTLPLELRFGPSEMAAIRRGLVPSEMDERWFFFYEDGVLHCHRSSTGICIYRVYFRPTDSGWEAWQVEINRRRDEYGQTDDGEELGRLTGIIEQLLILGPE